MPVAALDDLTCYYRITGPAAAPALMLAHSLGQDHGMWDPQAADLSEHFLVVRYDVRGHGASTATPGDYTIEQLGRDALRLADAIGLTRFAFCGVSLGGMIAQWLAAHASDRVTAVVLANTSSRADAERMEERRRAVLSGGMTAVAETVMSRFFSAQALEMNRPIVAAARRSLLATDPGGYAGCCAAIRDMNLTPALSAIRVPTLIIDGELDVALPWAGHGDVLARELPHARVRRLHAAHLSNLEAPHAFTAAVLDFLLASDPPTQSERAGFSRAEAEREGVRIRRAVLGDAHVDRALAAAGDTSAAFQDLITRFAWGAVWSRPGLDVRTRRLLTLAIAASLGRWEEFRLHVRSGLAQDLEWCDLEEVLLHTAVYAGLPAANTGFRVAAEEREALTRA